MPLDPESMFFDRRDPMLSEKLEQVESMLLAKLEKGTPEIWKFTKGDEELTEALKRIMASLVSILATRLCTDR